MLGKVFERSVVKSPLSVMTHGTLERVLGSDLLDLWYERTANKQYNRDMKPLFECELNYISSRHLSQIYDGFVKLKNHGILNFKLKPTNGDATKPLLKVKINNKYNVIYDTLDGLNWIEGSVEENLDYFKNNIKADFYFKRSYNKQVLVNVPDGCKAYPLGLYYGLIPEGKFYKIPINTTKDFIKNIFFYRYYKPYFYSWSFEYYPFPYKEDKILFLTRLWNPDDVSMDHLKTERELINKNRIDCIKACQREFGKQFIGGLVKDKFSIHHSKDLVVPFSLTKREVFLNIIKASNICISTTGLHNSIGSKLGEYVAASRSIVSEPLNYEIPGDFDNNKNYLTFNNKDELLNNIYILLNNKDMMLNMMKRNFSYYNNYLQPDKLVLNTLLKIYQNN
jgi:hypothetical protein